MSEVFYHDCFDQHRIRYQDVHRLSMVVPETTMRICSDAVFFFFFLSTSFLLLFLLQRSMWSCHICSLVRAMNRTIRLRSVAVPWSLFPMELSVGQVHFLSFSWRGWFWCSEVPFYTAPAGQINDGPITGTHLHFIVCLWPKMYVCFFYSEPVLKSSVLNSGTLMYMVCLLK